MLSLMRKNAGSWIIKIVLAIIIIVFAFWGVGSYGEMKRNRVAKVGGYTITLRDYDQTYRSMVQQAQANSQGGLTDEAFRALQLEKQALTQLINREVLLQEAKRLKLVVSDEELRDKIAASPEFLNEKGEFDAARYSAILSHMQITDDAYETMRRDDMLLDKLMELVLSAVKVSDAEIQEWYQYRNRQMAGKYAALNPSLYPVFAGDEELKAYYDSHQGLYMTQPMRKITYARFNPEDYMDKIAISDAEVREVYENNLENYSTPAMLDLSQIVIAIAQPGQLASEQEAEARALEAYAKLNSGTPFAEVVQEYSEPAFRQNDGRFANIPAADFSAYFGAEYADMVAGEITPPLKTDFAWYIFKLHEKTPGHVQSYDEVKDALKAELILNAAQNLAYDDAEEVSIAAFSGEDLEAAAGVKGVTAVATDYFDRGTLINNLNLLQRSAFTDYVFTFDVGDVTEPREFEGSYYVVLVQDEKAPELIPFDEVKVVVEHAVLVEKQNARALADAQKIIEAVKGGASLEDAAQPYDAEVKPTGFVTRNEGIAGLADLGPLATEALFSLNEQNPVINEPLPGPVVLVYDASAPADETGYETAALGLKMELLQVKRNEVFNDYLNNLKQKSKIWISDDFMRYYEIDNFEL